MNLIRFTLANIFDFKLVMDCVNEYGPFELSNSIRESNSDKLIVAFEYAHYINVYIEFINDICTPTSIEDLHE